MTVGQQPDAGGMGSGDEHAATAAPGSVVVTVSLLGELRRLAGRRSVVIELPGGASLGTLIRALAERCDPDFAQVLTAEGDLQSHVAVFIDGMHVPTTGMRTELADGRVDLMLLPMYEGG